MGAPLFIKKEGGRVKLEAQFAPNQICQLLPKECKMPKEDNWEAFGCEAEVPFLKDAPARLSKVNFSVKEQKFTTKIVKATVDLSEADWKEWKDYRIKLWGCDKAWADSGAGGDEKDKDKDGKDEKDKGEKEV